MSDMPDQPIPLVSFPGTERLRRNRERNAANRARWAKERLGIVTPALPGEAEARRKFILAYLEPFEGQSKAQRTAAVGWLNDQGYGDEEISEALRVETRRLEAIGDLLRNPPGFLSHRQRAAERIREEQGTYISDSTRKAAQNGR